MVAAHQLIHSSASNEWFTPSVYIESVCQVMGGIDLDPASNADANKIVKATQFFTITDDGLDQWWWGNVWLNPPYGKDTHRNQGNQSLWSAKLIDEFRAGNIRQAILLISAAPDRSWFQPLFDHPICFTNHRIRFVSPAGEGRSPTQGNAFVYFGKNRSKFAECFQQFGRVVTSLQPDES